MVWFSLLVLIPLAAIVATAGADGWQGYVDTLTNPQTWAAIKLTVGQSLLVTGINVVMGTLIAWVLVRDRFSGKRLLDLVIDIPFAMPTIVAGLVLLGLYGPKGPSGINVSNTRTSVILALAFVTLPFIVRTVQPVLAELDARRRGGGGVAGGRPPHDPASDRAALARPRDRGRSSAVVRPRDHGVRLAGPARGKLPYRPRWSRCAMLSFIESGDRTAAAAVATIMLVVALVVIVALDVIQRRVARRG